MGRRWGARGYKGGAGFGHTGNVQKLLNKIFIHNRKYRRHSLGDTLFTVQNLTEIVSLKRFYLLIIIIFCNDKKCRKFDEFHVQLF